MFGPVPFAGFDCPLPLRLWLLPLAGLARTLPVMVGPVPFAGFARPLPLKLRLLPLRLRLPEPRVALELQLEFQHYSERSKAADCKETGTLESKPSDRYCSRTCYQWFATLVQNILAY